MLVCTFVLFVAVQPTEVEIVLIPVGDSEKIEDDGKHGGSYLWKGHDFAITLPPGCADGTVTVTLQAYLPSSNQEHCLVSAVFDVTSNIKKFNKPINICFPHWVNVKSDTDKESLNFLICHEDSYEVKKGSFEVGNLCASIEASNFSLYAIFKYIESIYYTFIKGSVQSDTNHIMPSTQPQIVTEVLRRVEEGLATNATSNIENGYVDLLVLPEHDKNWGIYCIALDNPTYLQVM